MKKFTKYLAPDLYESPFEEEGLLCVSDWNDGSIDKDEHNDLGNY